MYVSFQMWFEAIRIENSIFIGKHAKSSQDIQRQLNNEGEREPSLGALDKHTQKAKDALNVAGNVLQNQVAMEEVKQELNKGGKGRVLFFFIIFIVNICLGKPTINKIWYLYLNFIPLDVGYVVHLIFLFQHFSF